MSRLRTFPACLLRKRIKPLTIGITVLDPAWLARVMPVRWVGEFLINGQAVTTSALYIPTARDGFYTRGKDRELFGIALLREPFVKALAALRGVGPEDVALAHGGLELTPEGAAWVRGRLTAILEECCRRNPHGASAGGAQGMADEIFGLMADAYLFARPEAVPKSGCVSVGSPIRIVRKAEERFMAAQGGPVSLADLCTAAGVSKSALYLAFHRCCGEPPLAYCRKRQLSQARSILVGSAPERGAVKRAALGVGLTELGRFSVEYTDACSANLRRSP